MQHIQSPSRIFSISQLKAFERNPFYWLYSYYLKLPQPKSNALEYGKKLHAAIEHALNPCLPIQDEFYQLKAKEAVSCLHDRIGDKLYEAEIEKKFITSIDDLIPMKGVIDIGVKNYFKEVPFVGDHKTVKNKRYALKVKDLKNDLQLIFYAYCMTNQNKNPKGCFIAHNQIYKDNEYYHVVFTAVCQARITKVMITIENIAKRLQLYIKTLDKEGMYCLAIQQSKDCSKCQYAFGGCPYREICRGQISIEEYKYIIINRENQMNTNTYKVAELSELVKLAKDFYSKKTELNKFDMRELIAKGVVEGIKKNAVNAVMTSYFLINGSDPEYTPVLMKLKENGIKILVEVN